MQSPPRCSSIETCRLRIRTLRRIHGLVVALHFGPLGVRNGAGLALSGRIRSRWGRVPLSQRGGPR
jgi:hypothetical protein